MPNLRLAVRTLARAPFVTAVAVGSLALGIGANTAIFSMFERILLRRLPVVDSGGLVNLSAPGPKPGSTSCNNAGSCEEVFSYPMYRDLEGARTGLAGLAAHRLFDANLSYQGQTLDSQGVLVSGSYFPLLGLTPALGRLFGPEDDRTIGGHFVTVLSHEYWVNQLGADPSVLDRTLMINGQSLTIVGVAPAGFHGTTLASRPRVYVPLTMRVAVALWRGGFESRRSYWLYVFGRLAPGGSIAQAHAALNAVYRPIVADVEAPLQEGLSDQAMTRFLAKEINVVAGARGQSGVHSEAAAPLAMLMTVTGIVLLIACINVANLLVARAANRSVEMAVRLSLGAGRRQLLGQLLTESFMMAAAAGLLSVLVARGTLGLLMSFLPAEATDQMQFTIDGTAMLFAAVVSLGTGLVFGLGPALHGTRPELLSVIKANTGRLGGRTPARFRSALVTAQIALSMMLLVTAGLFIRSLANTSRIDLGLNADNLVTFRLAPALNGYHPARSRTFFRRVEDAMRALPGVADVVAARVPVLAGDSWGTNVAVEGFEHEPDADMNARYNQVGAGYLTTMDMQLLLGREFTEADDAGGPEVAIVNEAFAAKFNLGRAAVGKRMAHGGNDELGIEIVGLMRDAKYSAVKGVTPPVFYLPYRQDTTVGSMYFYVRSAGPSAPLLRAIPAAIKNLDPNLPVADLMTLPRQIRARLFLDRMISTVSAAFAALATLLAAIGLYGVLAYSVAQRTREIGVRMALGASAASVRAMVLRQVGLMTAIGGAIGLAAAIGIGRAAGALLFEVRGHDPITLVGATVLLGLVALGAGYLPARRASHVHPMQALRYE